MIIVGSTHALYPHINKPNVVLYNINSPSLYGINISNILPCQIPYGIHPDSYDYDLYLADYINNNGIAFACLMNIMYSDYNEKTVLILIDNSWWSMLYIESLAKYIQARYGVSINIINEPDDILYCKPTEFSVMGRKQFQIDKENFVNANFDQFMQNEANNYE